MDLYDESVKFVDDAFHGEKRHFERTVYWIEQFIPEASEAQKIAAYSHDIERGIKGEKDRDYLNKDILERHQKEGAEIMAQFLKGKGADDATINTVTHLISKHEVGGDAEQNALMDADSVSYFETNAEMFVTERVKSDGYEKVKEKLDWMFNRISSEDHKKYARENYEKWSAALDHFTMPQILVTCYTEPDLDGFACAIAYSEFLNKTGRPAVPKFFGQPNIEARYLMQKFGFKYPPEVNAADFNSIILVDSSELRDLDKIIRPENVLEVIDHRKVNDSALFKNAKIQIEFVGSAATLIAEKFHDENVDISIPAATLLYGAIVSNTLNFRAKVTTDRDRRMAEWLNHKLGLTKDFIDEMFRAKSDLSGTNLAARIEGDFAWFAIGGKKIGVGQLEVMDVKELIKNRKGEILAVLQKLKTELELDHIFISIIDLGEGFNAFISDDSEIQDLLSEILGAEFQDNSAIRPGFIMRKEIVPLLKEKLE